MIHPQMLIEKISDLNYRFFLTEQGCYRNPLRMAPHINHLFGIFTYMDGWFLVDFYGVHVGKYSSPTDAMGTKNYMQIPDANLVSPRPRAWYPKNDVIFEAGDSFCKLACWVKFLQGGLLLVVNRPPIHVGK